MAAGLRYTPTFNRISDSISELFAMFFCCCWSDTTAVISRLHRPTTANGTRTAENMVTTVRLTAIVINCNCDCDGIVIAAMVLLLLLLRSSVCLSTSAART